MPKGSVTQFNMLHKKDDELVYYDELRDQTCAAYADYNTHNINKKNKNLAWKGEEPVPSCVWESIMSSALEITGGQHNDFDVWEVAQYFYDAESRYNDEVFVIPAREKSVVCYVKAKANTLQYIKRFSGSIHISAVKTVDKNYLKLQWD
jgi:hypothetical protein